MPSIVPVLNYSDPLCHARYLVRYIYHWYNHWSGLKDSTMKFGKTVLFIFVPLVFFFFFFSANPSLFVPSLPRWHGSQSASSRLPLLTGGRLLSHLDREWAAQLTRWTVKRISSDWAQPKWHHEGILGISRLISSKDLMLTMPNRSKVWLPSLFCNAACNGII